MSSDDWTFDVVAGIHLTGDQTLNGNYAGQTLFLAQGTFTAAGPLDVEGLILPRGVTLKPAAGFRLQFISSEVHDMGSGHWSAATYTERATMRAAQN